MVIIDRHHAFPDAFRQGQYPAGTRRQRCLGDQIEWHLGYAEIREKDLRHSERTGLEVKEGCARIERKGARRCDTAGQIDPRHARLAALTRSVPPAGSLAALQSPSGDGGASVPPGAVVLQVACVFRPEIGTWTPLYHRSEEHTSEPQSLMR